MCRATPTMAKKLFRFNDLATWRHAHDGVVCRRTVVLNSRTVACDGRSSDGLAEAELAHATAQGAWVQAKEAGRAPLAFDLPARRVEHVADV